MARNLVCGECGGSMQRGFIAEEGGSVINHAPIAASYWIEGKPEVSFWAGLKLKGKDIHYILAYRCERCGLMKFYAGPDHSAEN